MVASSLRASAGHLLLDPRLGLELAQGLVRPRHDALAGVEVAEDLDHRLAGDPRAHRDELGDAVAHHEHSRDLLLLAADGVVLRRDGVAALETARLDALAAGALQLALGAHHRSEER